MTFRHIDLFAGIGGFSRAVDWLGGETVAFVEWDSWCRRVLAKHWPDGRFFGDIHAVSTDDLHALGPIDLITGGYPCQPFSVAGKRLGHDDPRHLWPEMRRVVDTVRPRLVLAENVDGHVKMGLDTVLADLETDGYACGAVVVPASGVNALHKRSRVWIMAHRDGCGTTERGQRADAAGEGGIGGAQPRGSDGDARQVPDGGAGKDTGGADVAHSGSEAWHVGTGLREGEPSGQRRRRPDNSSGETLMAHAEARGVRCGRAPGHDGQPAQRGEGTANSNTDRRGLLQLAERNGEPQDGTRETPNRVDPLGYGPSSPGARAEIARPVDISTHGISPGLVRRPAARSDHRPRRNRIAAIRPAHTRPDSDWAGGDEYAAIREAQTVEPDWLDVPETIRAAWADGSWELNLPRVVAEEPERRQKLQAAGNAIVPLVAYEILKVMLGVE